MADQPLLPKQDETNQDARVSHLRSRLSANTESYRLRTRQNRHRAFIIKMATVMIGALVTILLGLQSSKNFKDAAEYMSNAALILSSVATVLVAWEAFFDHRWLWVRYSASLGELYSISDDLEFAVATTNPPADEVLNQLHERLQRTLKATNADWSKKRASQAADLSGPAAA